MACHQRIEKEQYVVIKNVIKQDSTGYEENFYYGNMNFILFDSTHIYFHDKCVFYMCGTGIDFSKPPRIYLYPDSLKEIKQKDLPVFLKRQKLKGKFHDFQSVSVSSPTDTIRNQAVFIIRNYFKNKKDVYVGIRKCTEEEYYVSQAKISGKKYKPDAVEWKIGFDHEEPTLEETIQFLPPIVDSL